MSQEERPPHGGRMDEADAGYAVEFGTRSGHTRVPADSTGFTGPGQLRLGTTTVQVAGRRKRPFRTAARESRDFRIEDICNVLRQGRSVRFTVSPSASPSPSTRMRQTVRFTAQDEAQASAIQSRLPLRQTEAFAQEQAERTDFHARLDRLSPRAWVTPGLIAVNVAVFIAMLLNGADPFHADGSMMVRWGSDYGPLTMGGQWWRMFTSMFLHFGVIHLALNMWALYDSGRMAERLFGSARFLLLYVAAGLAGSITSLLWNPQVNSAGASGAIFGVLGGLLAFTLNPGNGVPRSIMSELRNSALLFAGYSLFYGLVRSGIDNAAHIGGLIGGCAAGFALARPLHEDVRARFGHARFAVAAAGCALALAALAWPLAHASDKIRSAQQFQRTMMTFSAQEGAVIDATNRINARMSSHALTPAGYAAAIESEVLPQWDALYRQVAATPLAGDDPDHAFQQLLVPYLAARRDEMRYAAEAARHDNDAQAIARSKHAGQEVERLAEEIDQLTASRKR
jgi:rhomboid protease GluP